MRIRKERYFSIQGHNRPGELSSITASLMSAGVDCSGIWGFGTGSEGAEIVVVPRHPQDFKELAQRQQWNMTEGICFHLEGADKTGALVDILNKISKEKINLKAVDAIAVEDDFGCYIWAPDEESEHVAQILGLSTPKP
ncbi:MAG: hypothetical protein J5J00_13985 [Deltaproteobacteria bacterium]|nr:hypothetical protein [Deltaproteobacteria bacterium]